MTRFISQYRLQIGVFFILVFLLGLFMVVSPKTFLSFRIYTSFMSTIPFTAILALGLTCQIIAGEMDLSFFITKKKSSLCLADPFWLSVMRWGRGY